MAKLSTIKAKKEKKNKDKIARDPKGGIFKKPNGVWVQEFDDAGHQNPLIRQMQIRGIPIERASNKSNKKSKTG